MKYIKWKSLIITSALCLLPILLGLALWDRLPENIAIHFDINNTPDGFAPKEFAVFGLPIMMMLIQIFCCIVSDKNTKKQGINIKFERVIKWIIPIMAIVLHAVTFGYALGLLLDVRKIAVVIVSCTLLVTGIYIPEITYIKNYNLDTEKARKINKFFRFETVIMGIFGLISIFLPPIASVIWLLLLTPYTIIGAIYGIKTAKKNGN